MHIGAIALAIALAASKTFLLEHLSNGDGQGLVEVLKGDKLCQGMNKFIALFCPNVQNLIISFKHQPRNRRYVFSILVLKAKNDYCYIYDSYFPGQQIGEKMFCSRFLCMEMVEVVI